jgi:chaperonin GroEL
MTNIVKGDEAKRAMYAAIDAIHDAISGTLGPCAKTVVVSGVEGRPPRILNDGVSIVNAVHSDDPATQTAIELFRQISNEAQQVSGDGTTTASVLAHAMVEYSKKYLNTLDVKTIRADLDSIVHHIEQSSEQLDLDNEDDESRIRAVATIAANNDEWLGDVIADMFMAIGENGMVNMKVGSEDHTIWSQESGFSLPVGYASPMFANTPKKECVFDNPLIILADEIVEDFDTLTPALEIAVENSRPIVFMVNDIKGIALSNLIANKLGGIVNACAIRMPKGGYDTESWFSDTAVFSGSLNVFRGFGGDDDPLGMSKAEAGKGHFGTVDRIIVKENTTHLIMSSESQSQEYKYRKGDTIDVLHQQAEEATHSFDKEKLLARANRLNGTAATIHVGGVTELEIRETRERIDDAVNATRLALKGGVVAGGGWCLVQVLRSIYHSSNGEWLNNYNMWVRVLTAPYRQILTNAGFEPVIKEHLSYRFLDALTLKDSTKEILDPKQVVINSLKSAVSIVSLIINTDTMVILGE